MNIVSNITGEKLVKNVERRTASKTVRKFTNFFGGESLPDCISVSLDWLSMMVVCFIDPPAEKETARHLPTGITLEYTGHGTPVFNHSWNVYNGGEPVATLHSHSKSEKIIKAGICKLEILNHILYSSWIDTYNDLLEGLDIREVKNITRCDVALDGANHIPMFLNLFCKQTKQKKSVHMLGRASFDAKRMDHNTTEFVNFRIGSSHKKIAVYNKSSELKRSHKEYIRDAWKLAGLDPEAEQWRTELRLDSQAIKDMSYITGYSGDGSPIRRAGINIEQLMDPMYLLEIFRTGCNNFFDFVKVETDSNVSRSRIIDLFQFNKLKINILDKIPRAVVRGAYKAKMSIHNAIMCVLLNMYDDAQRVQSALSHVMDNIELYRLERFYEKKLPEWISNYQPVIKNDGNLAKMLAISRK